MFVVLIISTVISVTQSAQECGTLAPGARFFPWHVGIYGRAYLTGSGTLISDKVVITDAKEYSTDPKSYTYFVAAGPQPFAKTEWTTPANDSIQTSIVKEIHIETGFKMQFRRPGYIRFYTNDIAVMIVAEPFRFNDHVRPVCLNFDWHLDEKILQKDAEGKAIRWTSKWNAEESATTMDLLDLFVVINSDCIDSNLTDFYSSFGTDKICVRYRENNTALLCGDENKGTGLSFPRVVNGTERYYLQGVYSYPFYLAQWDFRSCRLNDLHEFTSVLKHESFIRQYWNESWADPPITGKCVLPPFPEHGSYVTNVTRANATDSEVFVIVALTVTCQEGYGVLGSSSVNCYNGFWPDSFPTCVRMCPLKPHPSVDYRCLLTGAVVGSRECHAREPPGTLVSPRCREPHYYSASTLPFMRCGEDGNWDYVAKCTPECGRVTSEAKELVAGGQTAMRGELPWHAGIYSKITEPYMQICGGSLISNNLIISAAHCFWTDLEKQLPASRFAVAVGKLYRPWNDPKDDAQKSDVKEIRLPERFQGASSNFQDDIAVLIVAASFEYKTFVRPVCLSFDYNFDRLQLQTINKGKVAGWGLTSANGKASPILRAIELPYVEVSTCIDNSPASFRAHITSDKICAGTRERNSALCRGDSGGGLSFPAIDRDTIRYYLRGVVSTAPNNDDACNTATYTSFTHIHKHEDFIKLFLKEL